jgi:hypothetical protein
MTTPPEAGARRWRVPLLVGAGLLLLQLAWILSLAPDFGIDEFDHAYRASSVADGHWAPGDDLVEKDQGRGDLIPVRSDVARTAHGACGARPYTGPLNCRPFSAASGDEVLIASAAARYNPTFYAVVGTVAKPFSGQANLYAMRIVVAILSTVLFVLALRLALDGAATIWPLAALLLTALPTTVYSSAVAAPNGLEMFAGIGAWVALGVVAGEPRGLQRRRTAYGLLALFSVVLANTHTMGLLWLVLILAVTGVLHGPVRTLRALLPRNRTESALGLGTAVAFVFEIGWVLLSGVNSPSLDATRFPGNPATWVLQGVVLWPLQTIGAFPMRNDNAPLVVYAVVLLALTLLLVAFGRRVSFRSREGLAMALVVGLSFVVPAYLTMRTFHQIGAAWQGRYASPFAVGLVLIAGAALDRRGTGSSRLRTGVAIGAGALVVAELVSQWSVMTTQRANHPLVVVTGWNPPSEVLLVLLSVAAAVCWCTTPFLAVPGTAPTVAGVGDPDLVTSRQGLP